MEKTIKRGDIYYADLSPVVGSEQGGKRPVLIISNDVGNKYSPTVIVAAITSKQSKSKLPTHYYLTGVNGIPDDSIILFEQIRTIDKGRLKEWLAQLNELNMDAISRTLLVSIGLKKSVANAERGGTDV